MNINIYYGGRGLIDDPTLYVIGKMQEVLEELRVTVVRYNLYEQKNLIATLPQTLGDVDGIILATTVEWFGIGGNMQQFLDACWLYGDKEKISRIYMQPVVMSTIYGEKEGQLALSNAWEVLGGLLCSGVCGYVEDSVNFELNKDYGALIEKEAENLYRAISQKCKSLPTSNSIVKQSALGTKSIDLTPQESEQLSKYVSDDTYIKKQKEDIEELSLLFRDKLNTDVLDNDLDTRLIKTIEQSFVAQEEFSANYMFIIDKMKEPLILEIYNEELHCYYGSKEDSDVVAKISPDVFESITNGRITFQRAFMTGEMTAKGNFKTLRMLDQLFKWV